MRRPWNPALNPLHGIAFGDWWRLLRENEFAVSPRYLDRLLTITLASLTNSLDARRERQRLGAAVEATKIELPPLFILGHARSGTTHLHHLLAANTAHFTTPTSYQATNPHDFLTNERRNTRLFGRLVPAHRPMDNLPLGHATPQEDEWALALMTLKSPYVGFWFPRRENFYWRYASFRGVDRAEIEAWRAALIHFIKKLTWQSGRTVLLKSPAHTARIPQLLEMFPRAKFVHIRRHPCEVFCSMRRLGEMLPPHMNLQSIPGGAERDRAILEHAAEMHDLYFSQRSLIPPGQLCEISFEDLERDPAREMAGIYERLALPGWDDAWPAMRSYLAGLGEYRKNRYSPLTKDEIERLQDAWAPAFSEWGYRPNHQPA